MRLFIDNKQADIDQTEAVSISLSVASLSKIESARVGYSKSIRIPMTINNMRIMGDPDQVNAVTMYNQADHTVRIEVDGFTVIDGVPYLTACRSTGNVGWYEFNIIGAGKLWVKKAAETMFKEIGIGFNKVISPSMITQSWSWELPIRFLPVQRDREMVENIYNHAFMPARILAMEDYHPFLHVRSLLDAIMNQAGYAIVSEFIGSDYFDSLYISGRYPTKNTDLVRSRMGFRAGRFANSSAVADRFGRVTAQPGVTLNSIGNVVDTADPKELSQTDGKAVEGVFCQNNCFQKIGNAVAFVPTSEVILGFEYGFRYTTDYYIVSRSELKGFNSIYLDDMQVQSYKLVNRFADRRDRLLSGYRYMALVFDHASQTQYQIRYDVLTNPDADLDNLQTSDFTTVIHTTFSSRTQLFTINSEMMILKTYLYIKSSSSVGFTPYGGDWTIYDGSVTERGTIEVEVTLRSNPTRVIPSKPKFFNNIYFGGADEGMTFTLDRTTTLKPIFASHPSEGTTVGFKDVAAHEIRQIEFVNAIKHLFNLYFYTNSVTKEVFIEPRTEFYSNATVVDWCSKVDYSKPIDVRELGADIHETIIIGYNDGDGTVSRWNEDNQQRFGSWQTSIRSKFTRSGEQRYANPMLCPSMNRSGVYPDAPDAMFLQVGDRDKFSDNESEELNFPAKIARYMGLTSLPVGQQWGWPSYGSQYPALLFHYEGRNNQYTGISSNPDSSFSDDTHIMLENGMSLCFEDRDGVSGLHRFYDSNFEMYDRSKRVTLYLDLRPEDIEPLIAPNRLKRDFRALYRLNVGGESSLFYLEEVCDYSPNVTKPTKCIFTKYV